MNHLTEEEKEAIKQYRAEKQELTIAEMKLIHSMRNPGKSELEERVERLFKRELRPYVEELKKAEKRFEDDFEDRVETCANTVGYDWSCMLFNIKREIFQKINTLPKEEREILDKYPWGGLVTCWNNHTVYYLADELIRRYRKKE